MLSSWPHQSSHDPALPSAPLCTAAWPVPYDELCFLARRRRGVPSSCFLHLPIRLVATDAAIGSCPFPSPGQGNGWPPLAHPGPKRIVCWTTWLQGSLVVVVVGVLRKVRRGIPQIPRVHTMTVGQKPQFITASLLGLLVACSFPAIQGTMGTP